MADGREEYQIHLSLEAQQQPKSSLVLLGRRSRPAPLVVLLPVDYAVSHSNTTRNGACTPSCVHDIFHGTEHVHHEHP